jgi:hypothetical protein
MSSGARLHRFVAADLARAAVVPPALVADFEMGFLTLQPPDLDAVPHALERAGVEFINGERPGIRLRK